MTTALDKGEDSASRPGHSLPSGKDMEPIVQLAGWPQGRYGQVRKILPPLEFDSQTVQPVDKILLKVFCNL